MTIHGRCHCGNLAFTLDIEPMPAMLPARACDCSFCVKHGGVWTSSPAGRLRVSIADADQVHPYAFGTKTATFHVCGRCGVVPVVTSEVDGHTYAVVSVNAFDGFPADRLQRGPASFDGEGQGERLARRARHWIADVAFVSAASTAAPRRVDIDRQPRRESPR